MFYFLIFTTVIGFIVGWFQHEFWLYGFYGFLIGLIIIIISKNKGDADDAIDFFDD